MSEGTFRLAALAVVALAVVVPLGLAVLHRPQRGVLLLAALLPFHGLLLVAGLPDIIDGWKEGLVLAVLAATFVAPASARGADGRSLPSWLLPVAGWFGLAALSAALVGGTQGQQGLKIGFFYVLLFWAIWRCPFDARDRDHLVTVLMGTGFVTAAWGLGQQVVGAEALVALGYEYDTTVRTTGSLLRAFSTFEQPFPFGLFVMVVLLVGLAVALAEPRRPRNTLFLVVSPVLLAGLLASTVRSAILGLAVGLLVLAAARHRGLLHALPVAALGIALVPAGVLAAFVSSDSLGDRTSGWDDMLATIGTSPLGIGIGSTGSVAEKVAESGGDTTNTLTTAEWSVGYQPDNYYMKTLLELGPLGLWMLLLLLVATLVAAWSLGRRLPDGPDAAWARAIAAVIAAAAAASTVATYLEIFPLDAYFWLLLGVLATLPAPAEPTPAVPTPAGQQRDDADTRGPKGAVHASGEAR